MLLLELCQRKVSGPLACFVQDFNTRLSLVPFKKCLYGNSCFDMGLNLRLGSWCSNVSRVMPRLGEVGEMHGK
jgi:hypothetical protein